MRCPLAFLGLTTWVSWLKKQSVAVDRRCFWLTGLARPEQFFGAVRQEALHSCREAAVAAAQRRAEDSAEHLPSLERMGLELSLTEHVTPRGLAKAAGSTASGSSRAKQKAAEADEGKTAGVYCFGLWLEGTCRRRLSASRSLSRALCGWNRSQERRGIRARSVSQSCR